jgi:phage terminase large subunit-like protein
LSTGYHVGVDAALKNDCAAVVAVAYIDEQLVLAKHRIWKPTKQAPLDLDGTIGAYLRELNDGYDIASVAYDPWQMACLSQQLAQDNLPMLEFPQSSPNLTAMSQNLFELIEHNNIHLYASVELRNHAVYATAVESSRGWKISKQKAANKIDGIAALAMATLQAVQNRDTGPLITGVL